MRKRSAVHLYVVAVSLAGMGLFAALLARSDLGGVDWTRAGLFAGFVLLGELLPITVPRQGEEDQITTSTAFALALMLTAGVVPAIVAQGCASVLADLLRRKPLWKAGFNAAQYALSLSVAAGVLD